MSAFTIDVLQSRRMIRWGGRFITAFNQGHTRNYLYPVYTPAGQAVTDETPVDHPHHRSIWIAAEEVNGYNFYIERAYGGRTAGAIREIDASWEQLAADKLRVTQTLEWRGASDWSDPDGRLVLVETRTTDIQPGDISNLLTIRSQLVPGGGPTAPAGRLADGTPLPGKPVAGSAKSPDSVTVGPTKHSYYGVRLADRLHVTHDGVIKDSEGRTNEAEIFDQAADWVDAHGPMAFDKIAGVGVLPDASFDGAPWFVRDYGSLCISTMRMQAVEITAEQPWDQTVRFVIHDGDHEAADIAGEFQRFRAGE